MNESIKVRLEIMLCPCSCGLASGGELCEKSHVDQFWNGARIYLHSVLD